MIRYNETEDMVQIYNGTEWVDWKSGGQTDKYLFNIGDQCIDYTGGWTYSESGGESEGSCTTNIYLKTTGNAYSTGLCDYSTINLVDFAEFTKLRIEYTDLYTGRSGHASNASAIRFYIAGTQVSILDQNSETQGILEIPITNITAASILKIVGYGYDYGTATITINKIWLTN